MLGGMLGGRSETELRALERDLAQLRALLALAATVEGCGSAEARGADVETEEDGEAVGDAEGGLGGDEAARSAEAEAALAEAEAAGLERPRVDELRTLVAAMRDVPSGGAASGAEWQRLAPKLHTLCTLLADHFAELPNSRAIAFVQRRSTVSALCTQLQLAPQASYTQLRLLVGFEIVMGASIQATSPIYGKHAYR